MQQRQQRRLENLASPGFLIALLLLLANDLIFKAAFHNFITGKLSDFAGLFAFPFFWSALLPRRKKLIYFLTAMLFVIWKSPCSQPLINNWNNLGLFSINRVIDYSDLVALIILPLAYYYENSSLPWKLNRLAYCLIISLSMFAFVATCVFNDHVRKSYTFDLSKEDLLKRIDKLEMEGYTLHFHLNESKEYRRGGDIFIRSRLCEPYSGKTVTIRATIGVEEIDKKSELKLYDIDCPTFCSSFSPTRKNVEEIKSEKEKNLLFIFEKEFIDRLKYGKFED
jgi:hypothetical protein